MSKKKKKCVCHECEVTFEITVTGTLTGSSSSKMLPQICPFCGDTIQLEDELPFLKDFDEYDQFDELKYFSEDEDELEDG